MGGIDFTLGRRSTHHRSDQTGEMDLTLASGVRLLSFLLRSPLSNGSPVDLFMLKRYTIIKCILKTPPLPQHYEEFLVFSFVSLECCQTDRNQNN